MFSNVYRISNKDEWEFFPVYTGHACIEAAINHFDNIRELCTKEETRNKLRMVPAQGKNMSRYSELNYLPYIMYEDYIIEVHGTITKQEELEKIKLWFDDYMILN